MLEYAAAQFYTHIPDADHIRITDGIVALAENGSEVIAGKILQLRLGRHYNESIRKATGYIIHGAHWLPCDTVGERVFGYALLTTPDKTIPVLQKLSQHEDKWVVHSVGVAVHYAVKKGLPEEYTDKMFRLLLSLATTTDFHTRKGIGWAAKTIAKFHPDIITDYRAEIENNTTVRPWFKTKIKIGLGRSYKYAHRYTG